MATVEKVNLQVLRIKNLPSLSVANMKIIDAVNDPDITIDELAGVISVSPTLAARLLGLANSAYFGCAGQVHNVKVAIVRVLGLDLVKSLAISVILNLALDTRKCSRFDSERFWMTALLTATLGQQYSHLIRDRALAPAIVYTSGLLLNIGLIVAVYLWPEQSNQAFLNVENNAGSVSREMAELIGEDQYTLGGLLLEHWRLPVIYQTAVKEFKNTGYDGDARKMLDLLRLCSVMARKIISDQLDDLPPLIQQVQAFGLSAQQAQAVIDNMLTKKEAIYTAALAIGGGLA
jgi:HD-like signal output (HDOD) protein